MTESLEYADLEIRVLARRKGGGYPVEMTVDWEQEFGPVELPPEGLLPWVPTAEASKDGERIFGWLFGENGLGKAWAEIRGQHPRRRIRLRISRDAPELHEVPWEQLRQPAVGAVVARDLAASQETPFSRYLAGSWRPGSPVFKRPLKVLLAVANPENLETAFDLQPIDVEAETELLRAATKGLEVELSVLPQPCTLAAIEEALEQGQHVLHYVGHGAYSERSGSALMLAGPENQTQPVPEADFAEMLGRQLSVEREDSLRLVFLCSCQTASRSPADAFRGFAPALVGAGVPSVVAMQGLVNAKTARAFGAAFYKHLLSHGQVDVAANEARSKLITEKLPGAALPVVFMRLRGGALLGKKGRISSKEKPKVFWSNLGTRLAQGRCLPILGPGANVGLLASRAQVAASLAEDYGYPLARHRRSDFLSVAQYKAINEPELLRDDYLHKLELSLYRHLEEPVPDSMKAPGRIPQLSQTARDLDWSRRVRELHENQIHHVLAEFELPLYLTTNVDNFMELALEAREGVEKVVRLGPQWDGAEPQYSPDWRPSSEQPGVFHLNGLDGDPDSELVLTEDDYFAQLAKLAGVVSQDEFLPSQVRARLRRCSFLFLGYRLHDWDFRLLLHGLVKPLQKGAGRKGRKMNIGVQLEPEKLENPEEAPQALEYVREYLQREYDITVYWGDAQQFVNELSRYKKEWDSER